MIHQRALGYLLGLEGVALLRAFAGEYDRDFADARIADIRRLLDSPQLAGAAVDADLVDTVDGYRSWSATYDEPGNGLYPHEDPIVEEILAARPPGVAVDAACGTGRHAERLAALGHRVIGVDSSTDMLAHARAKIPAADFRLGDLRALPVPDDHADLVTCALALVHVRDLAPVFAEFARVLRPGGHLLITDVHQELTALGSVPRMRSATGEPGLLPTFRHRAGDYLKAALPLGFEVRRCEEPRSKPAEPPVTDPLPTDLDPGPWDTWPWTLLALTPAATAAAFANSPAVIIWHFQLRTGPTRP
jgi:SAM-dependent methyltransferase